jgi:poly(hydroxyalkanoate) depolymerase family esterase
MRKVLVILLLGGLLAVAPGANADPLHTEESFVEVTGGARDYWLYTPAGDVPAEGRPLVVYLHGCTQNNDTDPQVAFGTRWNELAAEVGAVVLYPLQSAYDMDHPEAVEGNGASCWNWFLDKNTHRDSGEVKVVADLTRAVAVANHVDVDRVYVMGTSAGASMSNTLAVTYPDLYKAAALFAGCAYAVCADTTGRLAYDELTTNGLAPVPTIIFQGDGDTLSNVALGEDLLHQQLGTHDWADDGELNRSITLAATDQEGDPSAVRPAQGNPCVGPHGNWPCPAGATGWESYPYTVEHYTNGDGRVVVDWWLIHGLNHNYPNGDYRSTFTDPAGPDITRAAWTFFASA